jgi:hypothetical protein
LDISAIGKTVAVACTEQFDQMIATLGEGLSKDDQETLRAKLSEMQIGFATAAVGKVRTKHKGISQP